MEEGTRIIGGVSVEFWISGFGAQPVNSTKPPINNKMTHGNRFFRIGDIERGMVRTPLFDL